MEGGGRERRMRRRVEGMLVDGRRGKEGREGNAKKGAERREWKGISGKRNFRRQWV